MVALNATMRGDARFLVHEIPTRTTCEVADILTDICGAVGVAIWLDSGNSISLDPRLSTPEGKTLGTELSRFLEMGRRIGTFGREGGLEHRVIDPLGELILVMLPLNGLGQRIGALAVAIPADRWTSQRVFETCVRVAALAATVLESGQSCQQLEAELADAGQRMDKMLRTSEIDPLTKVENKSSFSRKAVERLRHPNRPAALLALDLDHFKQVNDLYGHQFGDSYLETVSEAIRISFPDRAIVGRTGGDEFCVLLDIPEAGSSYLESVINHVRLAIGRASAMMGKPKLGRVSIGASLFPEQAADFETLMGMADRALYASKRGERNTTTIFNSSLNALMATEGRDPEARLSYERITTVFQPVVDLATDKAVGVEVLARWVDESGVTKLPDSFGWMFRDYRSASRLTLHIVEIALDQMARAGHLNGGSRPDLWINVTDHDLLSPEFVFDLQSVMSIHDVPWDRIVIEVNEESMLGEKNGSVFNSLQEIRRRGGRVALDDFGTGYAGLTHVSHWPVDIIKIDKTFVKDVATDAGARVVVEALVMIANAMGQKIVAEGIETEAQLAVMRELGCDYVQGFLLARPGAAEAINRLGPARTGVLQDA